MWRLIVQLTLTVVFAAAPQWIMAETQLLDNGVDYSISPGEGGAEFTTVKVIVATGWQSEAPDERGISQLVRRVLWHGPEGTVETETDQLLHEIAVNQEWGRVTPYDTEYVIHVASDKPESIKQALEFLSRIVLNRWLDTDLIERERFRLTAELERTVKANQPLKDFSGIQDPHEAAFEMYEALKNVSIAEIRAFHRGTYHLEFIAVQVSGSCDPRVEEWIKGYFGKNVRPPRDTTQPGQIDALARAEFINQFITGSSTEKFAELVDLSDPGLETIFKPEERQRLVTIVNKFRYLYDEIHEELTWIRIRQNGHNNPLIEADAYILLQALEELDRRSHNDMLIALGLQDES